MGRNQKLSVALAAVAGAGGLLYLGNNVLEDIRDTPSPPVCKAAAQVAQEYKDQGYKGLAYGSSDGSDFFILTDAANKSWALVATDANDPETACVMHAGKSFETAQPTGRLLFASARQEDKLTVSPASFKPVSLEDPPAQGPDGYNTKELMGWLNSAMEQSTVFKGDLGHGRSVRVLESKDEFTPTWTLLYSTSKGKSLVEGQGEGFSFAQTFKPPMKHLE